MDTPSPFSNEKKLTKRQNVKLIVKDTLAIVFIWLIALAIVYMVYVKIKHLHN